MREWCCCDEIDKVSQFNGSASCREALLMIPNDGRVLLSMMWNHSSSK